MIPHSMVYARSLKNLIMNDKNAPKLRFIDIPKTER